MNSKAGFVGDILSVVTVAGAAAAIVWSGVGGPAPETGHTSTEPSPTVSTTQGPLSTLSGAPLYQAPTAPTTRPQEGADEPERPMHDYEEPGSVTDPSLAPELQGTEEGELGASCGATGMSPDEPGYDEWLACKHSQGLGG